jgi:ferredoxin
MSDPTVAVAAAPVPCIGCGILSTSHPVVAVMQPGDVPEGIVTGAPGPHGFVDAHVCRACHVDPAHRVRPIKGHFFERAQAAAAVRAAGSNEIGMGGSK